MHAILRLESECCGYCVRSPLKLREQRVSAQFTGYAPVSGNGFGKVMESVLHALMRESFVALHQCRRSDDIGVQNDCKLA
jgi:hypothetical protein